MCRTGGRRCPSYADPQHIAERNKRRREAYQAAKTVNHQPPTALNDEDYGFMDLYETREAYGFMEPENKQFIEDARAFAKRIGAVEENTVAPAWTLQGTLQRYTDDDYYFINSYHAGHMLEDLHKVKKPFEGDSKLINKMEKISGRIDEALAQTEQPSEPRALYRGMRIPLWVEKSNRGKWVEETFPVGGVVSQKSYMSTTANPATALLSFSNTYDAEGQDRSVIFEIISKQGAPLGDYTSEHGDMEQEVLMPREAKFKVVSVHHDVNYGVSEGVDEEDIARKTTVVRLVDESGS